MPLFLSDSSGARQQREMSSSDGDKQICLLQGVAVFNRQAAGRDELRLVPKFLGRHRGRPSRAPLLGILLRHALLQVAGETRAFAYAQEFVPLFLMRLAIVCELKVW